MAFRSLRERRAFVSIPLRGPGRNRFEGRRPSLPPAAAPGLQEVRPCLPPVKKVGSFNWLRFPNTSSLKSNLYWRLFQVSGQRSMNNANWKGHISPFSEVVRRYRMSPAAPKECPTKAMWSASACCKTSPGPWCFFLGLRDCPQQL